MLQRPRVHVGPIRLVHSVFIITQFHTYTCAHRNAHRQQHRSVPCRYTARLLGASSDALVSWEEG